MATVLTVGLAAVASSAIITREAYDAAGGGTLGRGMLLALARLTAASVLTAPAWLRRPRPAGPAPADPAPALDATAGSSRGTTGRLVAAGALLGLHFATWLPSLAFTSITASTTIVTTGPVWVALLLWIVRGERPAAWTGIGITVAIGGGTLVALGGVSGLDAGSNPLLGNALALVAAIAYAAHLLLGQEVQARGLGLWRWTAVVGAVGAVTVAPLALATAPGEGPFPLDFWLWALALTLVPQLVGHSSFTWAVRWLSPTLVSVVILAEPVLASGIGAVLYDETPGPVVLLGAVVLVAGVALTTVAEQRRAPLPAEDPVGAT